MNEIITSLFGKNFAPHGYCLAWEDNLLALHVISDASIFFAYLLIPIFLGIYLRKKGGNLREYRMVLALFALFILGCGFTHLMAVITIWQPWYYLEGLLKLLTAIVSITTASYLYTLIPKLMQMPSIAEILSSNQQLQEEILLRRQKEAELFASQTALQQSKAFQLAILKHIVDGIISIDDKGIILSFNKAAEAIFQYSADEVIGQNVKMLMPMPYTQAHDDYLANYINTGKPKIIGIGREVTGLCKDGTSFPMDLAVSEIKFDQQRIFSGIVRNITGRKQAEATAKQFEAIVQSSDDAIISKTLDSIVSSWNPGAETMFGYTAEEMIGQSMLVLLPANRKEEEQIILERIKKGEKVEHFETVRQCKDGTLIDVSASISPLCDNHGNVIGASKISRNITKQKKAEASLVEAKKAAEIANRAKSEFLANMSHEIRTPLNGVIGMIELVLDTDLQPKQQHFLKVANDSAELLLNVINDILDFSKIEAKKLDLSPHPFNLRNSVDTTISTLAMRAYDKNLELVYSIAPEIPETLIADSIRLQQVLINLIGNAIKFTEQGEVVVRIEPFKNTTLSTDEPLCLHVSVKDSGIGIAQNKQQQIFAAFTQSDASMTRTHGGTGLGLAISEQLVELMGGRIWVESQLGKGSTFHFSFQCNIDKNEPPSIARLQLKAELKGLRVLIVDDNSTNCLVLCEMLSSFGMKPFSIEKPHKALEILHHAHNVNDPFKLVISDYQMPELTGLQLAKMIREKAPYTNIPIIVLSSVGLIAEFEKQEKLALINAFIDKPVRQSVLLEKMESVLGRYPYKVAAEPIAKQQHVHLNPNLRILVAEDNITNQTVVTGFFEKQGLKNVTLVDNGLQAVETYQNNAFDVIFMDIRMPVMDGFQATTAIRELEAQQNLPHVPIVALTAHALKEDQALCLAKGMDYYTSKPIKQHELLKVLMLIPAALPVQSQEENSQNQPLADNESDTPQTEIFNLESALRPVDGDMSIFKRIIKVYLKSYPTLFEQLKQAVLANDCENIHDKAHTLKGSSSNFAAHKVVELAAQLEEMGKGCNIQDAESVLTQLEPALNRLAKALADFNDKEQP